ncbi:MAG: hypothetical protein QM820_60490 [Minicystis sp.]
MNRPPFTSSPPSQPSPYRYLGRGGGERPVKLQIIIALVAGLIIFAVPLYLWRRPKPDPIPTADAAVVDAGAPPAASPIVAFDAGPAGGISLSPFTTIKCEKPGPGKTPPERCDHVTTFEDALARAIRERPDCAPASKTAYTVSYVMETDFRRKKLTLFTGKSSSIKREKAKELLRCVKAAMPATDWGSISHQYVRYKVNVVATYPPRDTF